MTRNFLLHLLSITSFKSITSKKPFIFHRYPGLHSLDTLVSEKNIIQERRNPFHNHYTVVPSCRLPSLLCKTTAGHGYEAIKWYKRINTFFCFFFLFWDRKKLLQNQFSHAISLVSSPFLLKDNHFCIFFYFQRNILYE